MGARPVRTLSALALIIAGCSASGSQPYAQSGVPPSGSPLSQIRVKHQSPHGYIQHVIVIIQENRSFENFFAGYPGANAPTFGYAIHSHKRVKVDLHQTTFQTNPNLPHNWESAIKGWSKGKMDNFHGGPGMNYAAYAYVQRSQVQPYWDMANQYVLADAMFPTEFGGSYTGHLMAVAGTDNMDPTDAQVNYPTHSPNDCDSPPGTKSSLVNQSRNVGRGNGPFPCFTQFDTMANVLDNGGIAWRFYVTKLFKAGIWSPFEAISYVRNGEDWNADMVAPETKILKDIPNGQLAQVTWVTPNHKNSDHPGAHSDKGPSWVASIVNAVGESRFWDTSAIVVIWDDWGGWYDNAAPPQLDFRGLAIRVPCLIISPFSKKGTGTLGYVSHTQYEDGSILRFIEETFDLPPIGPSSAGYTDSRANSLSDSFDFTQPPRPFAPFTAKYPASSFLDEPASDEEQPVDEE
ncbi:MAG: alkaline phosphatase family protein [Candidatus Cybelea sp.]|jgi:phospholipase C